jgi:hypothetical protein
MSQAPAPRRQSRVPAGTAPGPAAAPSSEPWLHRGADATATAEHAAEQQAEKRARRAAAGGFAGRFWIAKPGTVDKKSGQRSTGEHEIVVLDHSLGDGAGLYEHNLKIDGKFGNYESCPKEQANCVLCDKHKESYYVIYITILDLNGYDRYDEKGAFKEHVNQSKRLFPITSQRLQQWKDIEAAAMTEFGTMRGLYLKMKRGPGDRDPRVGVPAMLEGGRLFAHYTEDQLDEYFGHDAVLGQDGTTVLKPANADITPFDYDALFPRPDAEELARKYGGGPQPGSARETVENWGRGAATAGATPPRRQRPAPAEAAAPNGAAPRRQRPGAPAPAPARAPAAAEPEFVMTDKAQFTYEQYVASGWTDKDLIAEGLMTDSDPLPLAPAPPARKPAAPTPPARARGGAAAAAPPARRRAPAPAASQDAVPARRQRPAAAPSPEPSEGAEPGGEEEPFVGEET